MKRITKYFSQENSVRGASLLLIVTLAISNMLGLLRDRFLAKNLSFSDLDIYFASFRVSDTLFNFLILGALVSAFLPIFTDFTTSRRTEEGFKLASIMINSSAIIMSLTAVIFYFIMPSVVGIIVPNFESARFNETVAYSRLLMITPIFFSVAYVIGGILNSYKRFFAYSLSPLLYNLSIIVGAVFLAPRYGITGVVYSVIAGSFLYFLILIPALIKIDFKYYFILRPKDETIKRITRLMIPRSVSLGASQILFTVFTSIGSTISVGAIAALNFANNIQTVPVVILGNSFATAVFPVLAKKISEGDNEGFSFYLNRAIRAIGFLMIPSSMVMILLRAQIVRLIIGTGKVDWDDTKMTALALGFFAVSLISQGLIPLLARAFFALKNTRLPMYSTIISVIVSIIFAYPLASNYSIVGLALAFSIGSFVQMFILFYSLLTKYPSVFNPKLVGAYLKILVISLLMALATWGTMHGMAGIVDMSRYWGVLTQVLVSCVAAIIVYLGINFLIGSEEIKWAFKRRINGGDEGSDRTKSGAEKRK